nr:zinc finger, CCHC-type [Tanacetum cinerariifolium]
MANYVYTLDGQAVIRKTLKVRKQLGEYHIRWKIKTGNLIDSCNQESTQNVRRVGSLNIWVLQLYNNRMEDTTVSTYLVNRSPSSAIGFETPTDMLGFFGWLAIIKQGMLEPVKVSAYFWDTVKVLQGLEFEVEPYKDHAFGVEPRENFDHVVVSHKVQTQNLIGYHSTLNREQHSAWELSNYRQDNNDVAFVVAEVEKLYAHESLTFNDTVACEDMAFISSSKNNSNEDINTACVTTASTAFPTGSVNVATISQDTASAYIASQSNGSQIKFEDINQIDEDDMEEIDIKWSMALLSTLPRRIVKLRFAITRTSMQSGKIKAVIRKTLKVRKQLGEYHIRWKIKTGNLIDSCNQESTQNVRRVGSLNIWVLQLYNNRMEDTTVSTYLVNRSPSSAIGFETPTDMLGFFGWLAIIKQGMLEPVKVLQGLEFEVEPYKDHAFGVEPRENFDHVVVSHKVQTQNLIGYHSTLNREQHSAWELSNYRQDNNDVAFVVAEVEKLYAHESLTFNDTVACEVISKCKVEIWVTKGLLVKAKENACGMEIIRDKSGNTLRVSQSKVHNGKLKEDMDARSVVYVLSNGCRKSSDDSEGYYWSIHQIFGVYLLECVGVLVIALSAIARDYWFYTTLFLSF